MKINRMRVFGFLAGAVGLLLSSCAYDPYIAGSSVGWGGGGWGGGGWGFGQGFGWGHPGFTTSYFISTGNPRWGYDPRVRCYYDYTRRCYYDPYLYGYYPVGYRPVYVVGTPHPSGWRQGIGQISPPSRFRDQRLSDFNNRAVRYRGLNTDWSRNIPVNSPGFSGSRDQGRSYDRREENRSGFSWGGRESNSSSPFIRSSDRERSFEQSSERSSSGRRDSREGNVGRSSNPFSSGERTFSDSNRSARDFSSRSNESSYQPRQERQVEMPSRNNQRDFSRQQSSGGGRSESSSDQRERRSLRGLGER